MLKNDETLLNISNGLTSNASEIQVVSPSPSNNSSITLNFDDASYLNEIKTVSAKVEKDEEETTIPKSVDLIKIQPAKKILTKLDEHVSNPTKSKNTDSNLITQNNNEDLNLNSSFVISF